MTEIRGRLALEQNQQNYLLEGVVEKIMKDHLNDPLDNSDFESKLPVNIGMMHNSKAPTIEDLDDEDAEFPEVFIETVPEDVSDSKSKQEF